MDLLQIVSRGQLQRAQRALAEGADLYMQDDRSGATALHFAAAQAHAPMIELLLGAVADAEKVASEATLARGGVDPVDMYGRTPLFYAAEFGHEEAVQMLLAAGGNPNAAAAYGDTPVHKAAEKGHGGVVRILLEGGGDPLIQGTQFAFAGKIPLDVAVHFGQTAIAETLQAATEPRVLTLRASRSPGEALALKCTTLVGNLAAELMWPEDAPASQLPRAVIAAVRHASFAGLREPLLPCNVRLVTPGGDGRVVDCGKEAPSLLEQLQGTSALQ